MTVHFFIFLINAILLLILIYLVIDYLGPKKIYLRHDNVFGMSCLRANDLIVQEYDNKGNLWATRGMLIYHLKNGDNKFIKVAHVPNGLSFHWLNNFTFIRRFTLRPECIEMTVTEDGHICAFSSGQMWYSPGIGKKFQKTLKLPHYGIGVGRGIMSTGIIQVNDKEFLFGEYFSNPERTNVRIYKCMKNDLTWKTAYDFQPGQIRHIHALQLDPYSGKLWICTGDEDKESMIGWSDDNLETIVPIGLGSQAWRACQLVFSEKEVIWGADTGSLDFGGIYHWNKENKQITKLDSIYGAVFFATRLANGTIIMSTDREGFPNEKDEKTRLVLITKDKIVETIVCGTWHYKNPGFRFNFAKLRFQRKQGNQSLAITCLNQQEIPNGDLIIISEDTLLTTAK